MDAGIIYANARIKALENNLLTTDKMFRMIDSDSLEDAVKVLTESNYGGGIVLDNPNKFENLLSGEADQVIKFIKEIMPKDMGIEIFFIKLDYHNAKALMKAKYHKIESSESMLYLQGTIDTQTLSENIKSDSYGDLYPEMRKALESIDRAFSEEEKSPRLIDVTLDKAYFKHAKQIAKKGSVIGRYLAALSDLTNISTFVRCRKAGLDYKFFFQGMVAEGELKEDFFKAIYEFSDEMVKEKFKYTSYRYLAETAIDTKGKALIEYETKTDDYLLSVFKNEKNDMFTVAPMAGYYLAKMTEIKVARMVLVCIKNKVDRLLIKQRLRELYA